MVPQCLSSREGGGRVIPGTSGEGKLPKAEIVAGKKRSKIFCSKSDFIKTLLTSSSSSLIIIIMAAGSALCPLGG